MDIYYTCSLAHSNHQHKFVSIHGTNTEGPEFRSNLLELIEERRRPYLGLLHVTYMVKKNRKIMEKTLNIPNILTQLIKQNFKLNSKVNKRYILKYTYWSIAFYNLV